MTWISLTSCEVLGDEERLGGMVGQERKGGGRSHGAAVNKRLRSELLVEPTLARWQVVSGSWHVPDRHDATHDVFLFFRDSV